MDTVAVFRAAYYKQTNEQQLQYENNCLCSMPDQAELKMHLGDRFMCAWQLEGTWFTSVLLRYFTASISVDGTRSSPGCSLSDQLHACSRTLLVIMLAGSYCEHLPAWWFDAQFWENVQKWQISGVDRQSTFRPHHCVLRTKQAVLNAALHHPVWRQVASQHQNPRQN